MKTTNALIDIGRLQIDLPPEVVRSVLEDHAGPGDVEAKLATVSADQVAEILTDAVADNVETFLEYAKPIAEGDVHVTVDLAGEELAA